MAEQALAVKYRPKTWKDVTEQSSTKTILQQQLKSGEIKNCYLFCGPAGCGKTTAARIFANEINKGESNPLEMDAASHSGVDDVREIIAQAKLKSIDGEYKVFIIDECHSISNTGWQAFLKLIEEPPTKAIFIFCTTDPQKIPKTILSRVQRYDFQRISQKGIVERLGHIVDSEMKERKLTVPDESLEYIAKLASGGMRDAITYLDKAIAFSGDLSLDNVVKALGSVDYDTMIELTNYLIDSKTIEAIHVIESLHESGKDLKQFVKSYIQFLLDVRKYGIGCDMSYIEIPMLDSNRDWLNDLAEYDHEQIAKWLSLFLNLNSDIRFSSTVKYDIEALIMTETEYFE